MATAINEAGVEKKMQGINNTQDGIQSMALWIIHHKANHEKIVDIWFKMLKKGMALKVIYAQACHETFPVIHSWS